MKKINTAPISGMQELLPENQVIFNNLKSKILHTYNQHGFFNIETPIIDRTEILFAKAGGDTEKQIYKVIKTTESADESDQALRFDHTVPLARYIVEHENNLTFPFKVSQVGRNFRGERAQKGRFREFYQCDIDVIGRNSLPIAYDADVVSTLLNTFFSFNLNTPILARLNNRKILSGLLESLNLQAKSKDIYSIIDHSEKVPSEKTEENFREISLSDENISKLLDFINLHGNREQVINYLNNLNITNPTFIVGVSELNQVMGLLENMSLKENIEADMKIVRGLDYYTGTVFEFILPEYKSIGSVCGGGRYENLTGYFTEQPFPGVGGSIGLTRLFYVLNEHKILKNQEHELLDYAIIPISEHEYKTAFELASKLRNKDYYVTVVLTDKKLADKLSYATKISKNGIVIGENEVESQQFYVKNFITGETTNLS
ncbi:histidine--tRNA ligase [Candidatus Saccharibacteria bacterium]|nr:histidine--tRNA ligase [Candidatus Saccharibacteria bacterium]